MLSIGCKFRELAAEEKPKAEDEVEDEEEGIQSPVILRTLSEGWNVRPLLNCIYGSNVERVGSEEVQCLRLGDLSLNEQRSRAADAYLRADGPRVMVILSPPGSGKTTVASAMAAEVARRGGGVQLLTAVQNVAVDNLGVALKNIQTVAKTPELGEKIQVYNLKAKIQLNASIPHPYDIFDRMEEEKRRPWIENTVDIPIRIHDDFKPFFPPSSSDKQRDPPTKEERALNVQLNNEECKLYSDGVDVVMGTVDMVLMKMSSYVQYSLSSPSDLRFSMDSHLPTFTIGCLLLEVYNIPSTLIG